MVGACRSAVPLDRGHGNRLSPTHRQTWARQAEESRGSRNVEVMAGAGDQDVETVDELTVAHGEVWRVTTLSSHYIFDLDDMTVTRQPGPTAARTMHDAPRHLATIVTCAVCSGGYWTMASTTGGVLSLQELWSVSTTIVRIERMR